MTLRSDRKGGRPKKVYSDEYLLGLLQEHLTSLSLAQMADKYNVSVSTISKRLRLAREIAAKEEVLINEKS